MNRLIKLFGNPNNIIEHLKTQLDIIPTTQNINQSSINVTHMVALMQQLHQLTPGGVKTEAAAREYNSIIISKVAKSLGVKWNQYGANIKGYSIMEFEVDIDQAGEMDPIYSKETNPLVLLAFLESQCLCYEKNDDDHELQRRRKTGGRTSDNPRSNKNPTPRSDRSSDKTKQKKPRFGGSQNNQSNKPKTTPGGNPNPQGDPKPKQTQSGHSPDKRKFRRSARTPKNDGSQPSMFYAHTHAVNTERPKSNYGPDYKHFNTRPGASNPDEPRKNDNRQNNAKGKPRGAPQGQNRAFPKVDKKKPPAAAIAEREKRREARLHKEA